MRIALAGSTGFIGKQLSDYLLRSGNELIVISRSDFNKGSNHMAKVIISADVIINLAGAPVLRKWTEKNKKLILASRVDTTRLLVEAVQLNHPEHSPKIFISASAIGIYDTVGIHNEFSAALGSDFLAEVCKRWEMETVPLKEVGLRLCTIRIGIVLGTTGGSLGKMLPIFKAGLGGRIGSGKQSFSFIHISDFCRAIEHLIGNNSSGGIYNLVGPNPTSNYLFTKVLSRFLHRPAFFTIPGFALRLIYGDAAEILTKGAYVVPQRLLDDGFQFHFPDISSALTDLIKRKSHDE